MFSYLALISRDDLSRWEIDARVTRAAEQSLGWIRDLRGRQWTSATRRSRLWVWTNEPEDVTAEVMIDPAGVLLRLGTLDADVGALLRADLPGQLAGKAGDYSLLRILDDEALAISTFGRQSPVYHARDADLVCVSNRALLAHLVLRDGRPVEFDEDALAACVAMSWGDAGCWTERTPFSGVGIAPPNSALHVSPAGLSIEDIDGALSQFAHGSEVPDERFYDELAELFLAGLRRSALPDGMTVALTGGKDSRVLVSALTNLSLDFTTDTTGFDSDPDVVVAKEVAAHLGLPHHQSVPPSSVAGEEPTISFDIRGNIGRELLVYDGMRFTVAGLPRVVDNSENIIGVDFNQARAALSTKGAEVWRGGYASRDFSWIPADRSVESMTSEEMRQITKAVWLGCADYLRPESATRHEAYVDQWLDAVGVDDCPAAAAERFFLDFEIGRRDAPSLFGYEMTRPVHQPFMQHEILRRVGRLGAAYRRDDHVHHQLIARFAPGVEDFPLERKRWGFEWTAPRTERERPQWEARAPLPVTPRSYGAWPMYGALGSDYWLALREQLFDHDDSHNIWSFVDREKMSALYHSEHVFDASVSAKFWVLYGLSVLMSGEWLTRAQPALVVVSRHRTPWPQIYQQLVVAGRAAQDAATATLVGGLEAWLAHPADGQDLVVENDDGPAERERTVADLDDVGAATVYPGAGRSATLARWSDAHESGWRVSVAAEAGSTPANTYLSIPLGLMTDVGSKTVHVRLRHHATHAERTRTYLVRYEPERVEIDGPSISFAPEWRDESLTIDPVASPAGTAADTEHSLLISLGSVEGDILIGDFAAMVRRRPSPGLTLRRVLEAGANELTEATERALDTAVKEHGLDDADTERLRRRAGLDRVAPTPTAAELQGFLRWARVEAARLVASDGAGIGAQLLERGRAQWPFLEPFTDFADTLLRNLLESSAAVQQAAVARVSPS